MTKLEKLYSIIENSREVGVKLSKDVLLQVEELEEGIIKEEILPALGNDIAPRLEPIKSDLVLVVEYHPGEPISVALSRKTKISEIKGAKTLTPRSSTPVKSEEEPTEGKFLSTRVPLTPNRKKKVNVAKLKIKKEAMIGDRIMYDHKRCTVIEKKTKKGSLCIVVQYDDGSIEDLHNDWNRYRVL